VVDGRHGAATTHHPRPVGVARAAEVGVCGALCEAGQTSCSLSVAVAAVVVVTA